MTGGHYFDPAPAAASRPAMVRLALPDLTLDLATDRGVFSPGAVDAGTRLLLLEAPAPPPVGDLVDVGCGYGPVALTLARRAPGATVWAVDVNARARALCAENAERHGLANVRVVAPADVPEDLRVDGVWSNPPVRVGKPVLQALLRGWLERLRPPATATLVVHRHLGADSLQRWLEAEGFPTRRAASRAGYRLLVVEAA